MLYTIGHSTLSKDDFLVVTAEAGIIIDTRSHPNSVHPHFCKSELEDYLSGRYEWMVDLGGWSSLHIDNSIVAAMMARDVDVSAYFGKFPKQRIAATRRVIGDEPTWTNVGLWDYSWFMWLPSFVLCVNDLIKRALVTDVTIMCCEAQWWRCHRSMIADYAVWRGEPVAHLMPHFRQKNKVKYVAGTKIVDHASVIGNRLERYHPDIISQWASLNMTKASDNFKPYMTADRINDMTLEVGHDRMTGMAKEQRT